MKIADKHIIYFLGIGGIGMSALARWFMHLGKQVCGYDKTETPLTKKLAAEGAQIHYTDNADNIPQEVLRAQEDVLVIFTPAIPKNHQEYNFLKEKNYDILKRSEVLGLITADLYSVAVAGTHGKTTTSSMIAHILKYAQKSCVAFMGGILQGYETNLIIEGKPSSDTIAVLEADEYDRSFLRLSPDIAVVTSADADHLDIYGEHDALKTSFREFIEKVKPKGHLFVNEVLTSFLTRNDSGVTTHSYSSDKGQNRSSNIHISGSDFVFDFIGEKSTIEQISLPVPGYHNVENAVAATAVALQLGISPKNIKAALACFKGVKRRFEYHIKHEDLVYIDDYAHHPTEIKAFLHSVKSLYPNKKVTAVFQPHLFSRTRDFADGFAESLDLADEVWLMNIYPARELPIDGVSSDIILQKMNNSDSCMVTDEVLLEKIAASDAEVLLTIGAGDIDRFVEPIKNILEKRQ